MRFDSTQYLSDKEILIREEFLGTFGSAANNSMFGALTATLSGTGTSISSVTSEGAADRVGIVQLSTGTLASGIVGLRGGVLIHSTNQSWECDCSFRIPSTGLLSDALNSFSIYLGFVNALSSSTVPTKGIMLWSHPLTNRLYYRVGTNLSVAGSYTEVDSGVTLALDTWYRLKISVPKGQARADFSLNDGAVTSISSNFPTGLSHPLTPGFLLVKSLGLSSRSMQLDWCRLRLKMP